MPPLLENVQEISLTPIQKFYSASNIFITGGTGLLGQLLVEKLLRSCPDIGNIYLLMRPKKNKDILTRLDEILDDCIFDRLKNSFPKYKYKIFPIEGDCSSPNLGITEQDRKLLTTEVSIVFHVAATVNFDEKLKTAVDINIKGTKDLLNLCKELPLLKAIMHVSTAFSNCAEDVIEETFYPVPIDHRKIITISEMLNEEILDKITPHLLGNLPNTYAFTKAIAEKMIEEEGKDLPIGVYRPSVVISTYKEPLEGWINNMYGAVGATAGAGAGVIRVLQVNKECLANVVPADMVINGMIAATWEIDSQYRQHKLQSQNLQFPIPIYNYESSNDCPITWDRFMQLTSTSGVKNPSINAIWYYSLTLIKHKTLYKLAAFFLHLVPAFLVDSLLSLGGRKRKFVKLYSKIHRFSEVISYFSTRNFKFKSTAMRRVVSSMCPKDRSLFFCDLKELDWNDYFLSFFKGLRLYLMKDPESTMPEAKRRWRRLYWCHQFVKVLLLVAVSRITWSFVNLIVRLVGNF